MRASRLLQILLLLQNRGRLTAPALAEELEVTPRTILRDVDAMTEAGLPVIVHRGARGGIELGFNYRTRLTGLAADEAEALAIWLVDMPPELALLGLKAPAERARAKLIESLPDRTRAVMTGAAKSFTRDTAPLPADSRVAAIAAAIRAGQTLRLRARSGAPIILRPQVLHYGHGGWSVFGPPLANPVAQTDWGDINISASQSVLG